MIALALAILAFAPATTDVVGRVVDPSSRPVPGAQVLIVCGASVRATTFTDDHGRFRIDDVTGRCELRVSLDGFRAATRPLELSTGRSVDAGTLTLAIAAVPESIVVSAAQADVPLSQAAASVSVITGDEMRARQLTTVADALREVPGLAVARTGSAGAVTGVFPRGGESDYSLVLIDGIEANAFGGGFDFAHLSADDIDRIEVVRGPQSALFGSNAIGSVIRIVTREGGPTRGAASVEGGRFGTSRADASASGSHDGWFWGGGTERFASDNFNGQHAAGGELIANDDYARTEAGASGGWRGAGGASIRGEARVEHDDRGFPGAFGSNPIGVFPGIDTVSRGIDHRWVGSIGGSLPGGPRIRTHAQVSWSTISSRFASPGFPDPSIVSTSDSTSRRWSARGQTDIAVRDGLDVSAGAEFLREQATSTFITDDDANQVPVRRGVAGYFGEARWSARDRLFVTGGLRVEDIRRDPLAGFDDPFSPRPTFAANHVVSVNPRIAAAWYARRTPGSETKLRTAAGTGIRPADAFEIAFTDNPSLKPERSRSVEAGVDQTVLGGRGDVEATAFRNGFDDLIVATGPFDGVSRFRTDNISNARAWGLELASSWHVRPRDTDVQAHVTYTFLDTAILAVDRAAGAPPPFAVGDPLLRRPRHQWSADVVATRDRLTAWIRGGGRGRVLDVEPTEGTFGGLFYADGYGVWHAGASWRLPHGVEVFGRVENLFNTTYEEALGFPALGRAAFAGIRIAAGR
ncbi:MAG TPA: TonB-dependent receptor [Vicinamibacterales bacterium]|nr:TonB-dependent receptor [Vicinamibacterales bacterium]